MRQITDLFEKGLMVLPVEIRGASQGSFNFVDKKTGKSMVSHYVELAMEMKVGSTRGQAKGYIRSPYGSDAVVNIPEWAVFGNNVFIGITECVRKNKSHEYTVVDAVEQKQGK